MKNSEKNTGIQILRILSMFMIILCHILDETKISFLMMIAQFLNVGVFVFLLISGFLYGNKEIGNFFIWIKRRFFKVIVPMYVFIIFIIILQFVKIGMFDLKFVFIYLFNLQFFVGSLPGVGHLWFITIIWICYLIVPILSKYKSFLQKRIFIVGIFLIIIAIVIGFFNKNISLLLFYIFAFILGFILRKREKLLSLNYVFYFILFFAGVIIRIGGKCFFDNTNFYQTAISSLSHIILGFCIFSIIYKFFDKVIINENSIIIRFVNFLDSISYYIYIIHFSLLVGPLSIFNISNYYFINLFIYLSITFILAYLLMLLINKLNKILKI